MDDHLQRSLGVDFTMGVVYLKIPYPFACQGNVKFSGRVEPEMPPGRASGLRGLKCLKVERNPMLVGIGRRGRVSCLEEALVEESVRWSEEQSGVLGTFPIVVGLLIAQSDSSSKEFGARE